MRSSLASLLLLAAACSRPVAGTDQSSVRLGNLVVSPQNVRADVPIDLSFTIAGPRPATLTWDLAGHTGECSPEPASNERLRCVLPGVRPPDYQQGTTLVVIKARDDEGRESVASAQVNIDFDCPRFVQLSVSPEIAAPETNVVVTIEASESLRDPPRILRSGLDWETPIGAGQSWSATHRVTVQDPAAASDLLVKLTDLAGNTSDDCGGDGLLPFAVDQAPPAVDPSKVLLRRDAPGTPATISASAGGLLDDVGIAEVLVYDETGTTVLARLQAGAGGSLPTTSLGGSTPGRVLLEVIDRLGRTSARTPIPEQWRLSLGSASTPEAAVRTAVRYSAAPASSNFLTNRTQELAPSLFAADARHATVRARVGFESVGRLPNAYEDAIWMPSGYDPVGRAIVTFGGLNSAEDPDDFDSYFERTLILRWNEQLQQYETQYGPSYRYGETPTGRGGHTIAFNDRGCGLMFGGEGLEETDDPTFYYVGHLDDAWQICSTPQGYQWTKLRPGGPVPAPRRTPLVWDPIFDRYFIINGRSAAGALFPHEDSFVLEPGATPDAWRYTELTPLPTTFGGRYSHLVYWDEEVEGVAIGLGYVYPRTSRLDYWILKNGQLSATAQVPDSLDERQGFGFAYDSARRQLVLWGDNNYPIWDYDSWFLTGTATSANNGWRRADLDPPVPRAWPNLVYDPDREVTVVYGGQRFDSRFVPADIHQIISAPSFPYLVANVDLAAPRPKGIERLSLRVRASGTGDLDGLGGGTTLGGGVVVKLWDHEARRWVDVATRPMSPNGAVEELLIEVQDQPERFVSVTGVVPVTVVTLNPATEAIEAVLEVDQIDGQLELRPGVSLP